MTQKPVCSIIIRAFNEEKHIGRLLVGINEQTIKNFQMILVDSGSTDNTIEETRGFPLEVIKIDPEEFTFGRSLNLGISQAKADLVVIVSAHVFPVYPDWLETLLSSFEDPQVGLVYGKQRGSESSHFSERQIFHHWYPEHSIKRQNFPFCNNANAAIRRSLWQQHAYDESLPGLEDLAWGKWAQESGWFINYVVEAEVIHVHNESSAGIFNRYRREGMAFKQIYPTEKFSWYEMLRLFFQNSVSDCRAAKNANLLPTHWIKVVQFRWAQFFGTYQGYRQSGPLTWQLKKSFYYPHGPISQDKPKRNIEPIKYN
ncbi:MAG: glycosyltransferase family 2 protein [Chloroflexi bacterium]|nr:glycosyltransferase family 2 protein [Chloroflexota bacterium]